jgi:hypothetical protein
MSRLVTQAVSEQPVVALVGAASPLRSVLVSFFERHDFAVAEFSQVTQFLKQETTFYKVLFIEGWSREASSKSEVPDSETYLEALAKALVSSRSVFFIQQHIAVTTNNAEYERKKLRFKIETEQPLVNIVLGQDVLFDTNVWWAWQNITARLETGVLVEPEALVYPISFKSFIRLLTPLILSPETRLRSIIRGQEQQTHFVVAEMVRQYLLYHQKKLEITQAAVTVDTTHETSFTIVEGPKETLPRLLQEGIQALPSPAVLKNNAKISKQPPLQKPQKKTSAPVAPQPPVKPVLPAVAQVATEEQKSSEKITPISFVPRKELLPSVKKITRVETQQRNEVEQRSDSVGNVVELGDESEPKKSEPKKIDSAENARQSVSSLKTASVDEQLAALFSKNRTKEKVQKITTKAATTKKITTKNKKRSVLFLGGVGVAGAALGALLLATIFWINQTVLRQAVFAQIEQPQPQKQPYLENIKQALQLQTDAYETILPAPFFDTAHELLTLTDDWLVAQQNITAFSKVQVDLVQQVTGREVVVSPPPADQVAYEEISRLYSRFTSLLEEDLEPDEKESIRDIVAALEEQRTAFVTYQQMAPLLPALLAQEEKRTYAVLFQNDQELRATGGFISAVGIVTLDQGQIIDTQVFSSYELDEALAAVISPPNDLKQVLGEERLYLRDANWNPDFPSSARQITDILQQQLNKNVDGVIALNTLVLEDVLRATGPLELDEYNELVTDRNLAERIEFHSEVTLVESDQSSDYASVILDRLLGKLTTLSREKTPQFLAAVTEQLSKKNMLISLANNSEQATFSLLGWTGEIVKPNCPAQFSTQNCVVDTLAVIDSNIGVNKANYHLDRAESHRVSLEPTQAVHTHTLTFTNTAQSNAWPKGTYQSYLRIIVPASAQLQTITVNDQALSEEDIIVTPLADFAVVGFVSSTPIQSSTKIVVSYETPHQLETGDAYTFFLQKQPGVEQSLSSIDVDLNTSFKPALIAPQAEVINEIISFKEMSAGHMFLGIGVK